MKQTVLLALIASLFLAGRADAQVVVQTQKVGKQSISTLEPVKAPADKKLGQDGLLEGKGVVLDANQWVCGRVFTDGLGRTWSLVEGPPLRTKPNVASGWTFHMPDGKTFFLTVSGSLYRQGAAGVGKGTAVVLK
jgi:hypothetical protein